MVAHQELQEGMGGVQSNNITADYIDSSHQ